MPAPFLTASAVDLFGACRASATAPKVREESEAAAQGTEDHAEVLQPGRLPPLFRDWFGREPSYERALAWDGRRFVALGDGAHRAYELPESATDEDDLRAALLELPDPDAAASAWIVAEATLRRLRGVALRQPRPAPLWLAGTADALARDGGVLSVADLKTGRSQARGSLPPPERSGQLRLLAWLAWGVVAEREPGWRPERVRVAWLIAPSGAGDGAHRVEDAELDPAELEAWAGRLRAAALDARERADFRPGDHCRYCPAHAACPAQGGALKRLSDLPGDFAGDEDAAVAYLTARTARASVERAERALRLYLERRAAAQPDSPGVDLGAGRVLSLTSAERREVDARTAVLAGVVPMHAADVSLTIDGVRRWLAAEPRPLSAVRPLLDGEADRPATPDDVLALLDQVGAVKRVRTAAFPQVTRRR